ncbi:ABC transporter ATP-binding protein [Gracilibacillus suaedae]|uniref:ABC transporter ATP-binding protein n=1 Tax=Gracilibacillus suaedae TaxID=2820273 RepID=UPI001ABE2465|nr:ABC transporter ATP-binding protein [Gracilibacillus suaedae]
MTIKLSIENLSKIYPTGEGVQNIDFHVNEGELVTLLGPSGCGKTTVLRSVGGFIDPTSGAIKISNKEVHHLPSEKRPSAMVFQSYNLWPHMTVFDNLAFSLKLKKVKKKEIQMKVEEVLTLVHLTGMEKKYPSELSGGQQQRIALARALLLEPEVLLLDEPFSALDAKLRHELREELREIQSKRNLTMLFVTHDQEEALSISDKIVVMNNGHIEQIDNPQEVYNAPNSLFVAQFIGRMNFIKGKSVNNTIQIGDLTFIHNDAYTGDVTIGIRPEDIQLATANTRNIEAQIDKIMMLGHFAEITLKTMIGSLKMFVDRQQMEQFVLKSTIPIQLNNFLVFKETGEVLNNRRMEVYENI